ncbi:hypothetical protein TSUD_328700 [Trifolium subterraneum]|uniref:Peptidase C1A papain C-terminal domain-containing protein n=1 Tax=Trifolium subterraneum TaxID=3900 RepID=A0A2Z6MFN5_TRISU|nr:hypothetical protein TSUD_328700 [Trifolium subterraneum]
MEHFRRISGYVRLPVGESFLQSAVSRQPVSVLVALNKAFKEYVGGIFEGPGEVKYPLNRYQWHALNVIGYGTEEDGRKYWIFKNSWGKNLGEDEFMRMRMKGGGRWGLCAIAKFVCNEGDDDDDGGYDYAPAA